MKVNTLLYKIGQEKKQDNEERYEYNSMVKLETEDTFFQNLKNCKTKNLKFIRIYFLMIK